MNREPAHEWREFRRDLDSVGKEIAKVTAKNVNADHLRESARDLSQRWFREDRVGCIAHGIAEESLRPADAAFQQLLRLSTGRNLKTSYSRVLKQILKEYRQLETARAMAVPPSHASDARLRDGTEQAILLTLKGLLSSAAASYEQVLLDLDGAPRVSYRGTATELREAVREVLDHMAPDADVMSAPGFKLEKDQRGPTMKQKARFILRARGLGDSAAKAPEDAVQLLEEQTASLARSVYVRGAASTHSATTRDQVVSFKRYADAVLAELLQVARAGSTPIEQPGTSVTR
jgi:hypothetical protein